VNERDLYRLVEMVSGGRGRSLVITGAGVSTESGIPDYRSPEGSYNKGHKPMMHQEFVRKEHNRKRYWARSLVGWRYFDQVEPSYPHHAFRKLEEQKLISGIITQNVDRLHLRAGSKSVVELHGYNDEVGCLSCGYSRPRREYQLELEELNHDWALQHLAPAAASDVRADGDAHLVNEDFHDFQVPACPECGDGVLMPKVVFFGGSIPKETKDRAMQMVEEASSLLVFGSSCQVASVFRLCKAAADKSERTPIALINIGPTRVDNIADLKIEAQCGRALRELCTALDVHV